MEHSHEAVQHESHHLPLPQDPEHALAVIQAAQAAQQNDLSSVVNGAAAAIQAAAAVAAASAWANTAAASAAITEPSDGSGMELAEQRQGGQKARRAAWTADEEDRLKNLAERYANAGQRMCWRLIAQELNTGRTSKQCREHYLNSLRPNMKKGQWTQKEEYIIAREHAKNGSHWCIIAKKLPGRTDNSIKNFYNATVRSKAVNKNESFLWVYVDKVTRGGLPPKDAFAVATEIWQASVPAHVSQEVLNGAADDGVEGLMMLGKRKPEDEYALAEALIRGNKLQQLMASLGAGGLEELAKRQKMDGLVSPNAAAAAAAAGLVAAAGLGQDRQRQELLQQLGLAPQQQQLEGLQVLQQQLLLQQLIAVAHNSAAAAGGAGGSSGGTPPAALPAAAGTPNAANSAQLIQLMQQIATQSHMALQQQPQGLPLPGPGNGGDNSMLSQLLMQHEGAAAGGQMDAAAAIAAAAAAAGMEAQAGDGSASQVKSEPGADMSGQMGDAQIIQAAMAAAQAQQAMAAAGAEVPPIPDLSHLASMANVSVDAVLAALPTGDPQ